MNIEDKIKQIVGNDDEYITGFADLSHLVAKRFEPHVYAVVIGKRLDRAIIDSIESGPNIAYYNHYNEINTHLSTLIHHIADELKKIDISSIVIEPTRSHKEIQNTYSETLRTDFSHKMAATRAGLGWIGKTDLFVSEKFGPRLRLTTLLTDYPLKSSNPPIDESKCGECNVCIKRCPARAANGKLWNIHIDRDEFFNPFKCKEKCIELCLEKIHLNMTICGICVSVCPIGRKNNKIG